MNHSRAFLITITALATALPFAHAQSPLLAPVAAPAPNTQNAALRGTGILPVEHSFPPTTPLPQATTPTSRLGLFDASADVGTVLHPGTTKNVSPNSYMLSASGENIWGTADAFQFAYKKMSGDIELSADISFVGAGTNPHRKAVLMIRQSLDANSPYVDAALHGSGLLSLQYRDVAGGPTTEIETLAPQTGLPLLPVIHGTQTTEPVRIRLVKCGRNAYLYMALKENDKLAPSGASIQIPFHGDFYVGIGLSSHEKDVTEEAIFSNVTFGKISPKLMTRAEQSAGLYSTLETIAIDSTIRTIALVQPGRFEAPNWTRDAFLFNREGRVWRLPAVAPGPPPAGTKAPAAPPEPVAIDTGFATRCNNDHGISPDGTHIAISDQSQDDGRLEGLHAADPEPAARRRSSPRRPPTGTAGRPTARRSPSAASATATSTSSRSPPTAATNPPHHGQGLDDGPEYSPDGSGSTSTPTAPASCRSGGCTPTAPPTSKSPTTTGATGSRTFRPTENDGHSSYDADVNGHPADKDVQLRLLDTPTAKSRHSLASSAGRALSTSHAGRPTASISLSSAMNSSRMRTRSESFCAPVAFLRFALC